MAVPTGVDQAGPCVELSYVDVDAVHGRRLRPLRDCVTGRFEDVPPVCTIRWSRGDRNFPGWYWAATTGRHVGFESPTATIRALLDNGAADRVVLAHSAREARGKATADGWTCAIVTNGRTVQQETKIRNTGLDQLVQAWVVSGDVGHKKPEGEWSVDHGSGGTAKLS